MNASSEVPKSSEELINVALRRTVIIEQTASVGPAASFNLRLSEILPGSVGDFGRWRGEDFR